MASGLINPMLWWTIRDDNDVAVNGGKLYTYLSGTLTPASIYTDGDLSTAYSFPAVSDSVGRIGFYMDPSLGNLKFIQTDASDVPIGFNGGIVDPVTVSGTGLGEVFIFCANSTALITNTSYESGATFDKLQPGSSVWSQVPDLLSGTHVLEIDAVVNAAATLTVAVVNLSDGAPDTPIAEASITSLTGALAQSAAITFPSSASAKLFGIKSKVSANSGFVVGARIRKTV